MDTISEIIKDLGYSAVDLDVLKSDMPDHLVIHVQRAAGQVRAAIGCLDVVKRQLQNGVNVHSVNGSRGGK